MKTNLLLLGVYVCLMLYLVYRKRYHKEQFSNFNSTTLMSFKLSTAINNKPYYVSVADQMNCPNNFSDVCVNKFILSDDAAQAIIMELEKESTHYLLKYKGGYLTTCCEKYMCFNGSKKFALKLGLEIRDRKVMIKELDQTQYITYCKDVYKEGIKCVQMCLNKDKMAEFLMVEKQNNPNFKPESDGE